MSYASKPDILVYGGPPWVPTSSGITRAIAGVLEQLPAAVPYVVAGIGDDPLVLHLHFLAQVDGTFMMSFAASFERALPPSMRVDVSCRRVVHISVPGTIENVKTTIRLEEPAEACGTCGTRAVRARRCGFCGARA